MLYAKEPVGAAARAVIDGLPDEEDGVGSLIALDREGTAAFAMSAKNTGTYRGYVTEGGELFVALFRDEPFKRVKVGR